MVDLVRGNALYVHSRLHAAVHARAPGGFERYCSKDCYVVFRYNTHGSSYYLGFDLTMRFTNPTGAHMCGKFKVTAVKANSNF